MRNFIEFDSVIGRTIDTDADFETGPIVWGAIDRGSRCNLRSHESRIPIFSNLFKRQKIPKECIVCTEEKFEIDYGSWEQWSQAYANFSGPWTWTVLEYPISQNQQCTHQLDVCRLCVAKHISISLDNGNFERIMCPQCDRMFAYSELKKLCHENTFRKWVVRFDLVILFLTNPSF